MKIKDKLISIEDYTRYFAKRICINCQSKLDCDRYNIPLCYKCRDKYISELSDD